jgi:integrase
MLAFVQLMCWSALAIRDAACLERSRIRKDPDGTTCIVTSRAKTGVNVRVPIPDEVAELLAKVVNGNPKYVFWNGTSLPDSVAKDYQAALRKIFAEAKIVDGRSRRFRDTAAVEWLKSRQLGLFEVSKLLGHTNTRTTEQHYAPWVQDLQDQLKQAVMATCKKPNPEKK